MKISVKAAVRTAAQMLGVGEGVDAYFDGGETEEGKKDAELLLECFNRVENELALDYLPLIAEQELSSLSGDVMYAQLSKPAVRILCVEDEEGNCLKYRLFPDRLKTQAGGLKVIYAYSPAEKSFDGVSDYQTVASERLFVYGMAAEYALAQGELEAASVWDKKYKEAIEAAYRLPSAKRLRLRRWI